MTLCTRTLTWLFLLALAPVRADCQPAAAPATVDVGTRFAVPRHALTTVLEETNHGIAIAYRATSRASGHAFNASDAHADWLGEVEVALRGTTDSTVRVEVVDARTLMSNIPREVPLDGAPPTSLRVSVGGTPLMTGVHHISSKMAIRLEPLRKPSKALGNGYVERVEIEIMGDGSGVTPFRMHVTSAKAAEFADAEMQLEALHLDCDYVKFDRRTVRGPLTELWGLQPMSAETTTTLSPEPT